MVTTNEAEPINVVYTCFDYTSVISIASLLQVEAKNGRPNISLFILLDPRGTRDFSYIQKLAADYGASLTPLDASEVEATCAGLHVPSWGGHYLTYARLFLTDLLPQTTRVVFIDADTLILRPIDPLWNTDLKGKAIAGVHEISYGSTKNPPLIEEGPRSGTLNGGVLLFDLAKLRSLHFLDTFIHCDVQKLVGKVVDQTFINEFFGDQIVYVDPVFNSYSLLHSYTYARYLKWSQTFRLFLKKQYKEDQKHPVIIHFNAGAYFRPWFQDNRSRYSGKWRRSYKRIYGVRFKPEPLEKGQVFSTWFYRKMTKAIVRFLPLGWSSWMLEHIHGFHE